MCTCSNCFAWMFNITVILTETRKKRCTFLMPFTVINVPPVGPFGLSGNECTFISQIDITFTHFWINLTTENSLFIFGLKLKKWVDSTKYFSLSQPYEGKVLLSHVRRCSRPCQWSSFTWSLLLQCVYRVCVFFIHLRSDQNLPRPTISGVQQCVCRACSCQVHRWSGDV